VVVTTASLAREVEAAAGECRDLREVLIVDDSGESPAPRATKSLSAAMARARDHFVAVDTAADDPAFVAYTSGTTGDPKGIVHLQRYAKSYDYLIRDWHRYGPGSVCACPPEIGWMLPVASAFLYAFRAGVTVLLYREREPRFRPEAWLRLIEKHRVTDLIGTPTIYRMLLTVGDATRFDVSSLVRGTSAGEPLPPDTFARVRERFGFPPLDGIGMSECMVYAHNFADDPRPGSCGRPGRGLELAVLDDELRPVAAGEPAVQCAAPHRVRRAAPEDRERQDQATAAARVKGRSS
jgi:acetyl-CoA synthetase